MAEFLPKLHHCKVHHRNRFNVFFLQTILASSTEFILDVESERITKTPRKVGPEKETILDRIPTNRA